MLVIVVLLTGEGLYLPPRPGNSQVLVSQGMPRGTVDPNYTVRTWLPGQTWNGTTIFGNSIAGQIVEVNMYGEVVWRYQVPFTPGTPPIITDVMVLPGSNNVLYSVLDPPNMRGAYEVNRQGQLVWSYANQTVAHDAVRLPSGDTLLAATHSEDYGAWPYLYPEVFEVGSQGNVVWQWHAKDYYANSTGYASVRSKDFGSWTHTNDALRLPSGNTIISLRNFNITIMVGTSGKVLQSFGDPCSGMTCRPSILLDYPDSPYPLSNGNYLISESLSGNVVELNPTGQKIVWQWPPVPTLNTPGWVYVLDAQRLPNGNTMVVDGNGQLFEVNPSGQVVWLLRCGCYNNSPGATGKPFFRGERTSYMPPGFTVQSPTNGGTYTGSSVPLSLAAGTDLGNVTYSVRNDGNGTWIVRNSTLLQNIYNNSLTAPTVVHGPSSLNLRNGNYTLRILAGSTGWGYKAFIQQKRINYATQDIVFSVAVPAVTTSSSSTSSQTITSSTSLTTSTTTPSTTASSQTQNRSSTTTSSTVSSQTAPPVTSTSTTPTAATTPTSTATETKGGGGIPEFPYQPLAAAAFAAAMVLVYAAMRRGHSRRAPAT